MNIILCGIPGSGKSYFGAIAAQTLNRPFIDTDDLVMSEYFKICHLQATCREIVLKEGNFFFCSLENNVLKGLKSIHNSIIAIGGGALCMPENIPILRNLGWMIYLKASPQVLLKRLMHKNPLPSYIDQTDVEGSFDALLTHRLPLYEQNCHCCVDVNSENVLERISHYACRERCHGE